MFRFKQFNVDQSNCAMKINTDGVLLGALAEAEDPATILDIGTGTGVIALMLAQRFSNAQIDAVEIDEAAAKTAGQNFSHSPFADRLIIYADDFEGFSKQYPQKKYSLIVSNPPFYINSLESPGAKKNLAKHAGGYFFENLIRSVASHLTKDGTFWLILPLQTAELVKNLATQHSLHLQRVIAIKSYPDSIAHREILVLNLNGAKQLNQEFIIYAEQKVYSEEYQDKLKPFFTIFK